MVIIGIGIVIIALFGVLGHLFNSEYFRKGDALEGGRCRLIEIGGTYYLVDASPAKSGQRIKKDDWFYCSDEKEYGYIFVSCGSKDSHIVVRNGESFGSYMAGTGMRYTNWPVENCYRVIACSTRLGGSVSRMPLMRPPEN